MKRLLCVTLCLLASLIAWIQTSKDSLKAPFKAKKAAFERQLLVNELNQQAKVKQAKTIINKVTASFGDPTIIKNQS